ncbi:MAG TPA: segregation/condensation protein A [Candidatus Magasanikbacteria bacterium]|nr:segregation/condensation protein A [Candidatus Magasanikbacteria bacterium]
MDIKVGQFSGPLDLLLALIQDEKLEISEVSISKVTEQFLQYLEALDETDAEELADFLVIAAKLLFAKSKHLLSSVEPDEEEGPPLEEQLRLYRLFVETSKKIDKLWLGPYHSYVRIEEPRLPQSIPLPENLTLTNWSLAIANLLKRISPPKALPETRIDRTVSLKETISRLKKLLEVEGQTKFSDILGNSATKTEIIVSFLALLELVKQREAEVNQTNAFSDIHIVKA